MRPPPTFQSVLLDLQHFWADRGCLLWRPYHTEVGAGTMNPATFLRVLGPEPWRVAYLEPSIRPDDARYGDNPHRLWQHYQFQVILKPDPGNPQDLYLDSLRAIGIDLARHDLRFVEDQWEAPALGAWGLGWEVWLDGEEITQFTYFQQAGGLRLDPPSVELTYGLERILMALQGVDRFESIRWDGGRTYGDVNLQAEREQSRYALDTADVGRLWTLFETHAAEARAALEAGLVHPALDHLLKCSHTFNVLDSRAAVGVAERAALFARMRDLARGIAEAYLQQRQELGFPWMDPSPAPPAEQPSDGRPPPDQPADFVLEIGTEELPAGDLAEILSQLETAFPAALDAHRLRHAGVQALGTPRRLVVRVSQLAPAQEDELVVEKGPPAERAYDAQGSPTQAAVGFAKAKGVPVESLAQREMDGGRYVVVEVQKQGRTAEAVLPELLSQVMATLRFERAMRWDGGGVSFPRPIRWLVALHGGSVVPWSYAGLPAGRTTRGLRSEGAVEIKVGDAQAYGELLEARGIVLSPQARREAIRGQLERRAASLDGTWLQDDELLEHVANTVEAPYVMSGEIPSWHASLPRQAVIAVMRKQRCFLIERGGRIHDGFLFVANGRPQDEAVVRHGNEQVVLARLVDARYFLERDLEQPLEAYLARLGTLTFQAELGSMLDKAQRLERLVSAMGPRLGLTEGEVGVARRAARLAKADLATRMVVEMTDLHGEMGYEYALRSGEEPSVAQAIREHVLPRFAGDALPEGRPGIAVAIADRLDTLVGLFAAGMEPSGTRDPFGLRRAALGVVQILKKHRLRLDLHAAIRQAAEFMPIAVGPERLSACGEFIRSRLQTLLLADHRHDVVDAVLQAQGHDPAGAEQAAAELEGWVSRAGWPEILQSYARCARILRGQTADEDVLPELLELPAEKELFRALQAAESVERAPGSVNDFLEAFRPMIPAITRFFEDVLVMAEDERRRRNRLALLRRIVRLADGAADLSRLEGF